MAVWIKVGTALACLFAVGASLTARGASVGTCLERATAPTSTVPQGASLSLTRRYTLFSNLWETVDQHHVFARDNAARWREVRSQFLASALGARDDASFYAVLRAMIAQLRDGHSWFQPPWEVQSFQRTNAQAGVGVGIWAVPHPDGLLVLHVFPGTSAASFGLRRRDVIVTADGRGCPTWERLLGQSGTTVTLGLRSPGGTTRELVLVRRPVREPTYFSLTRLERDPSVALLTVSTFLVPDVSVSNQIYFGLAALLQSGPVRGVILDLRANGGGALSEIQKIAGQFLEGPLFEIRPDGTAFPTLPGLLYPKLKSVPLVVLVDQGSQSASELLTASLQARGRARVVGVRTIGNTEVVKTFDFGEGSRLWLAVADAYLPDGTRLGDRGVIPDVALAADWFNHTESDDPHILAALELLR